MRQESVSSVSKDLVEDFSALRSDVAKLTGLVAELARSQAAATRSGAADAYGAARHRLHDVAEAVRGRRDDLASSAGGFEALVERNPVTTVLVAVLGGLMLGLLTRPRS